MLNAFRHHRNSHYDTPPAFGVGDPCSTPFGIIGIHTRVIGEPLGEGIGCSTPFGIIGIHTSPPISCFSCLSSVLNAFRHHRNSHSSAHSFTSRRRSAQRLSASSEFTRSSTASFIAAQSGAQRLSASSEFTRWSSARRVSQNSRAQRLSASSEFTPRSTNRTRYRLNVLNAFRHHRNSHCSGSNPLVCCTLQLCFRASVGFVSISALLAPR